MPPPPPGRDASPLQGYPQLKICQYPFILLGGERYWLKPRLLNPETSKDEATMPPHITITKS